jgi:lactoylglutathione lyase
MFTSAFPIVSTPDMDRALGFYRDLLEGKVTYAFPPTGDPGYVALDLGTSHIGIGLTPDAPSGPQRIALWLYTNDCDAAVDRLRAAGTPITEEPTTQPWGERVAHCLDPDGNEIIIGSPAPPGTDPESSR